MSEKADVTGTPPPGFLQPKTFLLGFVLGLALCSLWARVVSHRGYHPDFTRFHQRISPEGQYYPTVEEMCGIVRSKCRPDQILVLVGGNSVFYGVGQPVGKVWTEELQRRLGDGYCVINFAFRGASCLDGGAVIAEVLRQEFPRQIYVANTSPFVPPHPLGVETYRTIFWEARSRGLLEEYAPREELVRDFLALEYGWDRRLELAGAGMLDRVLRYHDLWNWVGYEHLFTIPNPMTPHLPHAIWGRRRFRDEEGDFESMSVGQRLRSQNREAEMKIVRGFSGTYYFKDYLGRWRVRPVARLNFQQVAKAAMPDNLRPRTLIMLSHNDPYYLKQLTPDERLREDAAYREGIAAWRQEGYRADEYGADYAPEDFGDRTHLTASGGRKLALHVARLVQDMAARLHYLQSQPDNSAP
jgi:hypothetical protein